MIELATELNNAIISYVTNISSLTHGDAWVSLPDNQGARN